MTVENKVVQHALVVTTRSHKAICEHLDKEFGFNYSQKNPQAVSCLIRFQEEVVRSTTELLSRGVISIQDLG